MVLRRLPLVIVISGLILFAGAEAADRCYRFMAARQAAADDRGAFVLFVIGESSAAGEPYTPAISFPKITSRMFGDKIGARAIRIRNLARPGSTLYPQVAALERELRYRGKDPGAVFIYSGHNESGVPAGRFPAVTALVDAIESGALRRSVLLTDILLFAERSGWVNGRRDLGEYERNLRRAVDAAQAAGLTPVLSTLIANVSDIEPALPTVQSARDEDVLRIVDGGERLEEQGRFDAAISYYQSRLTPQADTLRDYLSYRIGKCHESRGRYAAANRAYWEVIDSGDSGGFNRASSAQNAVVAKVAQEYSVPLVDAVAFFERHAAHGMVGNQYFADGHHPNVAGYILLAAAFGEALSKIVAQPLSHPDIAPQELFSTFGFDTDAQIYAHLSRAGWLLTVSADHLRPRMRMRLARIHIQEALSLGRCQDASRAMLQVIEAASAGSRPTGKELARLAGLAKDCRK